MTLSKSTVFIAIVVLLLIAFFSGLKCGSKALPQQKLTVDSTRIKEYMADTSDLHWMLRNTQHEYTVQYDRADSLQGIVNLDEARLGTRAVTINSLVAQVKHYEATRDTTALLDIIDSLTDEVEQGIAAVRDYEGENHRLDSAYKSIIKTDSATKEILGKEVVDCNNFAFALQLDIQQLRQDSAAYAFAWQRSKKTTKISLLINAILAGLIILKK